MAPFPPKKKLPQTTPEQATKPQPNRPQPPVAKLPAPPPAKPGQAGPPAKPVEGAEQARPTDPNAPSQAEAEAGSQGGNTTNPNGDSTEAQPPEKPLDTEPLRFVIQDEPGQGDHSAAANGTDALHSLMLGVGALHEQVPPEMWEQVGHAANHLGDAYRQANFGQHEGAAMSIGHAVDALGRAKQVGSTNPDVNDALDKAHQTAVNVGQAMSQANTARPPWNPMPVKRRGLAVVDIEGKVVFSAAVARGARATGGGGGGRTASGGTAATCRTCGTDLRRGLGGGWEDRQGRRDVSGHTHAPDDRQRDDHGRFA